MQKRVQTSTASHPSEAYNSTTENREKTITYPDKDKKKMAVLFVPRLFVLLAITAILSSSRVSSSVISGHDNLRKLKETPGMQRCMADKMFFERVEIGTKCHCREDDNGIALVCSDECTFCNRERTVCGMKSDEALYDVESGSKIGVGQAFEYLKLGPMAASLPKDQRQNDGIVIGIEELDCEEEDTGDQYILGRCSSCNVYFDGTQCKSCNVTECGKAGSGVFAPVMDCTNLQDDAVYDFCSDIQMEDFHLFQAFLPDQFQKCLPMENLLSQ